MSNKRRIFKMAIYSVYIYLFVRRFFSVLRYFSRITMGLANRQMTFMRKLWQETITFNKKLFDSNTGVPGSNRTNIVRILFTHLYRISGLILSLFSLTTSSTKNKSGNSTRIILRMMFHNFISMLGFLYNSFIFIQLSCIGVAESQRIRRLI